MSYHLHRIANTPGCRKDRRIPLSAIRENGEVTPCVEMVEEQRSGKGVRAG